MNSSSFLEILPFRNFGFKEINSTKDQRNFLEIYLQDFCKPNFFEFLLRNVNSIEQIDEIYDDMKMYCKGFVSQKIKDELTTIYDKLTDPNINYKSYTMKQRYAAFGKSPLLTRPSKEIKIFNGKMGDIEVTLKPLKIFKLRVPDFLHFGYESCTFTINHEPKKHVSWKNLYFTESDIEATIYHNNMVMVKVSVFERYTRIEINFSFFNYFYPNPPYKKTLKQFSVVDMQTNRSLHVEREDVMMDKTIKILLGNNMDKIIKIYLC